MAARPTTTVGDIMSVAQGVMGNPRLSNSIARLIRESNKHRDISQHIAKELDAGVLASGANAQMQILGKQHADMAQFFKNEGKRVAYEMANKAAGPAAMGSAVVGAAGALVGQAIDAGLFDGLFDPANNPDGSMPDVADMDPDDLTELQRLTKKAYETDEPMVSPGELKLPETFRPQPPQDNRLEARNLGPTTESSMGIGSFAPPMFDNRRFPGGQKRDMPTSTVMPDAPVAPKTDSLGIGDFSPGPFKRPDSIDLSLPQKKETPSLSYADTEMAQRARILDPGNFESQATKATSDLDNIKNMTPEELREYFRALYAKQPGRMPQ